MSSGSNSNLIVHLKFVVVVQVRCCSSGSKLGSSSGSWLFFKFKIRFEFELVSSVRVRFEFEVINPSSLSPKYYCKICLSTLL